MIKGTEGLIYEERLKKPKTQSQDPEMTSGNMITDSKYLKGVNHQREFFFMLGTQNTSRGRRCSEGEGVYSMIFSGVSLGRG